LGGVFLPDYEKMYFLLFNAITDAEHYILCRNYDLALAALFKAQISTEAIFVEEPSGDE